MLMAINCHWCHTEPTLQLRAFLLSFVCDVVTTVDHVHVPWRQVRSKKYGYIASHPHLFLCTNLKKPVIGGLKEVFGTVSAAWVTIYSEVPWGYHAF